MHTLLGKKEPRPPGPSTALLVEAPPPPDPAGSPDAEALVGVSWVILFTGLLLTEEKKGAVAEKKGQLLG